MNRNSWLVGAFLVSALCLSGCMQNNSYRDKHEISGCKNDDNNKKNCEKNSFVHYHGNHEGKPDYTMAFVEIDEQGIMQDRKQMEAVLSFLGEQEDAYVIIYAHGWHHNAKYTDKNVEYFSDRLRAAKEYFRKEGNNKEVVGVYIGWRGGSVYFPLLKYLTFWDRKNVSEEIGRNALTEFLLRTESLLKRQGTKNVLITTGHSFGASAIYNSLRQILLQRLLQSDTDEIKGFGDMVVLINPAIEAMRFTQLRDAAQAYQSRKGFIYGQKPVLIVAASEADSAVKIVFPAGRSFNMFFENHRDVEPAQQVQTSFSDSNENLRESQLDKRAIGHFEPYTTHLLKNKDELKDGSVDVKDGFVSECHGDSGWLQEAVTKNGSDEKFKAGWNSVVDGKTVIKSKTGLYIEHLGRSAGYDPYWIIRLDDSIASGHNEVSSSLWCFVNMVAGGGAVAGSTATDLSRP